MGYRLFSVGGFLVVMTACVRVQEDPPANMFLQELPDGVLQIAAPYQNLTAVKIDPSDGCYVYQYVGRVETTFLPLRTVSGRPICTKLPATGS
jgi:hypothetical protein